ncbi:MAG: hypothetical protein K6E47_07260 [Lachnospiraceae bacterium]|nr:hypothetical protein [Lachnospiraceae bacterium]
MKHFKLMKGMLACLLSLALVVSCFYTGANAATFSVTKDGKTYVNTVATSGATAEAPVVISAETALSGMKTTSGEALEGVEFDAGNQSSSGAGWEYSSTSGFVISSADAKVDVAVKATSSGSGDVTAAYDPNTDTIVLTAASKKTVYYTVFKKAEGGKVNASKFKNVVLEKKTANSGETTDEYKAVLVLDNKEVINAKATSDLYVYYTTETPATAKTQYVPNFKVNKHDKVKGKVTFDYDKIKPGNNQAAFTLKDGETVVTADKLIYRASTDDKGKVFGEWKPATELTGSVVAADVASRGKKLVYQFKVVGTSEKRSSDSIKGEVKLQKAVALKVNYEKATINIKNGFDYTVVTVSGSAEPTADSGEWFTILPYKVDGSASGLTVPSADYVYGTQTKTKISGFDAMSLFDGVDADKIYVFARKSATNKKAAGAASVALELTKPAVAPSFSGELTVNVDAKKNKTYAKISDTVKAGGYQYLIVTKDNTDLSAAKWTDLKKDLEIGKANSTVAKRTKNILSKDGNTYVLIRKKGVKNTSLPSEYAWTQVYEEEVTGASGEKTKTLVWKVVPAPEGTSSNSGEESGSGEFTVTIPETFENVKSYTVTDAKGDNVANGAKVAEDAKITVTVTLADDVSATGVTVNDIVATFDGKTKTYSADITVKANIEISIVVAT